MGRSQVLNGFLWGPWEGRGWGRDEHHDTFNRVVFAGRHVFANSPILYDIYYVVNSGGFTTSCFKTIENSVPDLRFPFQTRTLLKFRQPDDLFHTLKTM
jgi:hypothetical protein